jgi:hypothetical protein
MQDVEVVSASPSGSQQSQAESIVSLSSHVLGVAAAEYITTADVQAMDVSPSGAVTGINASGMPQGIIWGDVQKLHPMLDFVNGRAYTTVALDLSIQDGPDNFSVMRSPYLIGEQGLIGPVSDETLRKEGLTLCRPVGQVPSTRWRKSYIRKFVEGERTVDAGRLFRDILNAYKNYVYFEEPEVYLFITLWVMGTYLYPIFPAYPMVLLNGPKRSGKSRTLITTSLLAFNAMPIGDPTSAIIFRLIDEFRPTLIFDETEWLSKKELDSSIGEILKFGYKKGFKIARCSYQGKNPFVETYESYCPKMLSNIRGAEDVLADRTITITQRRKPKDLQIADIDPSDEQPMWAEIRHRLYLFMFSTWRDIQGLMPDQSQTPLKDREYEMAVGILSIARYIERTGDVPGLYTTVLEMITRISEERESNDMNSNHESIVIQALLSSVNDDNWYSVYDIMQEIKKYRVSNSDWINEEWTGRTLLRLGVGKSSDKKKRSWTTTDVGKKNLTHYFITRHEVEDLARKYGVPFESIRYPYEPEPGYMG